MGNILQQEYKKNGIVEENEMASIKDVAKKANVGPATVSRVLNNSGYVSEQTRLNIEAAMKELDYRPNELARNLYHKKTGIIAVLVPTIANPFFAEFVYYAEEALYNRGYKTMICDTVKAENAELEYLDMLKRHIVDGVITGVHSLDVEEYLKIGKPIVALDRYLGEDIPVVAVNHKRGGAMAAEELIQSGCKSVLHFRGSLAVESPYHDRHYEFEKVMKEHGVKSYSYELEWNRFDMDYYRDVIEEVCGLDIEFDGVFGVDQLAIGYMNAMVRKKKKVPEDLKVVAYDGTYLTKMVEPQVTSIVQPIDKLAQESVRLVSRLANGRKYNNRQVLLEVELRKGRTT